MPEKASKIRDALNDLVIIIVCILLLVWGALAYYYSFTKASPDDLTRLSPAMSAVDLELQPRISDFTQMRLEPLGGDNLVIYLLRRDFESVPYPDREQFVSRIAESWCESVGQLFFPSVKFRDIRSGASLGSYSCVLKWASLE